MIIIRKPDQKPKIIIRTATVEELIKYNTSKSSISKSGSVLKK